MRDGYDEEKLGRIHILKRNTGNKTPKHHVWEI